VQVLALVKASGTHIQSVRGWRTVTALISMTALHPEAAPLAFDALSAMVRADTLSPAAFQPALDTAFHFAERHSKVTSPTTLAFKPQTAKRACPVRFKIPWQGILRCGIVQL
jgi:hypothetical protein